MPTARQGNRSLDASVGDYVPGLSQRGLLYVEQRRDRRGVGLNLFSDTAVVVFVVLVDGNVRCKTCRLPFCRSVSHRSSRRLPPTGLRRVSV